MGEVYRARDSRLARDVAIKVLPPEVAGDPDRLARFEREAQVLASLNHPNIAAIHGVEDSTGVPALVMELVEGPTLADRIAKGVISIDEALPIAKQIAEALEAAHEQGIIHRDLKPANVKVRLDGTVKVLDFGLAKVFEAGPGAAPSATMSPTLSMHATQAGLILGTAAYMSPEQAAGRAVDKRSDLWAFGVILFEMLTGRQLFSGETVSHVLASVLKDEPDWTSLPADTPIALRTLLRRCLEKERKRRLHDIGDARLELEDQLSGATVAPLGPAATNRRRLGLPAALGLAATVAAASGMVVWYAARQSDLAPRPLKRFAIDLGATPLNSAQAPIALSPDGTKLAYSSGTFEGSALYVRSFDQRDPKLLPGTTSAYNPFFSPDGQWVGFSASNALKKVPASGGPVVTLSTTDFTRLSGAVWGPDGQIYFAMGESGGLWSMPDAGGRRAAVSELDAQQGEVGHVWPDLLPGNKGILFTVLTSTAADAYRVAVQPSGSKTHRTLVEGASLARYVPTGHLIYVQAGKLFAAPFDVARLSVTGSAVEVLDGVSTETGRSNARFTLAGDGTLAFVEATRSDRRSLVWVDRRGVTVPVNVPPRAFSHPSISPDGKRVVVEVNDRSKYDLWQYVFDSATFSRLTLDGTARFPVWTPDGKQVAFGTVRGGSAVVAVQDIEGFLPATSLIVTKHRGFGMWPGSWSPDGQTLAFMQSSPASGGDIAVLNRAAGGEPQPFVSTAATEWGAKLSPDGRWMAYISNESGQWEVYLQPFPGPGNRRQVSSNGGSEIVWARNGLELFYRDGSRMMAVPIRTTPSFSIGNPEVLFEGTYLLGSPGAHNYDVTPDGQRFLMIKAGDREDAPQVQVILNWLDDVKTRVRAGR